MGCVFACKWEISGIVQDAGVKNSCFANASLRGKNAMKQTHAKRERIIEAVRQGLEGDAAVDFVRLNGYAVTSAGIAHHLRMMGGRARVMELIEEGNSNYEILALCFPGEKIPPPPPEIPSQPELFEGDEESAASLPPDDTPPFETTKLTLALPNDLYEAVRIAARAEGKRRNDLIVEILTAALSRMPLPPQNSEPL